MQKYLENDEFVDKVYEAVKTIGDDAIPLIEEHLNIHFKDGKCCCPFHQENTPSFVWNPKTKTCRCFGCGKHYNIVNVLVDKTGSHKEALNELFRMAHMEVNTYGYKPFDGGRTDWFANYKYPHPEHEPTEEYSIKYLNMRGISKQTIDYAEVKEDSHGNIAFEYRDLDNKLLCVKYRASHKLHKGEAKMWFQKDASTVPILYNVKKLDYLEPLVVTEGECFPPDAEILTPNGWVRFDEYNNEQVMQYNEDGTGEFVTPLAYIKHEYNGELWEINKAGNYYTCTTPNHNIVYVNKRGETIKRQLSDMPNTINGYIPRVLSYNGSGLNLSDDEIRLQVAFSADGSFNKQKQYTNSNTHRIRFAFTKERKAIRLKEIMDKTGIQYTYTDNPKRHCRYYIGFTDEKHFLTKEFNFEWLYKMNTHQREVMIEEIQYWDGYSFKTRNQSEYYSVIKNNVDFIQTLCHTTNRMSTIKRKKNPSGFSNVNPNNCQQQYTVSILHGKQYSSFQQMNKYLNKYMYAGFVYCVQVPSGMILVRQHEKITVIGNCDALSVIEAGYTNVCSVPNGAGSLNWVEFNYDYLQNFQTLILWFDNDPAGQEGLNKIIPRLGEYRCKIVKPTSEDEQMVEDYYSQFGREGIRKTDANNILLACGKQRVIELINRAEEIPAKNLKYLMDCEISDVKDMEKVSTGLKGMDDMLFGNLMSCFTIYTGKPGCVDCDTEYFNGTEWKRIADYTEGEKVLQYNADGTAKLVIPEQYHKYEAETLWHFKTRYGLDQCLSDEHNVYYITSKNNIYHKTFKEVRENHERAVCGFKGKFITSFEYSGNGIDLTDEQIELMCAVICDGNFSCDSVKYDTSHRPLYDQCCVTVKKERKKKRMRDILNRCHIEWKETLLQREGYSTFTFFAPRHEKVFTKYWYNCNQHQLQVICNNVLFWDGCLSHGQKTFSTSIKESADFIQFAFTSCGYKAHICTYDTKGQIREINRKQYVRKSMTYIVSITNKNTPTMSTPKKNEKVRIDPYHTKDGFKYCFTVPSHMWVMRRNNCICITGNSGKSSLCNLTSIISPIEQGHKVFVFSGELAEGQLLDWIMSPLAGLNHLRVWDSNSSARKAFTVTNEAEIAIRKYYHDNIILYSAENELATSEDALLEAMETAFRKYGCDTFVIDNMMTVDFTSNGVDNKYEQQKKFITRLMNFTNSHTVNVNCIIHPKKVAAGEDLDIYSLHGCSEYSNLCHRLIAVKRLTDDEEGYSIECQIIKDRPTQAAGKSCKLMYDTATRRIYSTNEELSQKFSWEKSSNITYPDAIKKNLLCNRKDVLATIPKIVSYSAECDQY